MDLEKPNNVGLKKKKKVERLTFPELKAYYIKLQ